KTMNVKVVFALFLLSIFAAVSSQSLQCKQVPGGKICCAMLNGVPVQCKFQETQDNVLYYDTLDYEEPEEEEEELSEAEVLVAADNLLHNSQSILEKYKPLFHI